MLSAVSGCTLTHDGIIEAVLLHDPPHPQLPTCLTVQGKDPSPALLQLMHDANSNVVPDSHCKKGPNGARHVNGRHAEHLMIDEVRLLTPWRAEVECASYSGPLAARGWTVRLERVDGVWKVKSSELDWISLQHDVAANRTRMVA